MKIALAQIRSLAGMVERNINHHLAFMELAAELGADLVLFPELSITGYEPSLAEANAGAITSPVLDPIHQATQQWHIVTGVGFPVRIETGIAIGLVFMGPDMQRTWYAKQFLHPDEEPFFEGVCENPQLPAAFRSVGLAICYELSVIAHAKEVHRSGKSIYLASVAKSEKGVMQAHARMANIASSYQMITGMVNSIGPNDDFISVGGTTWWDTNGNQIGNMDTSDEGILLLNTETMNVKLQRIQANYSAE